MGYFLQELTEEELKKFNPRQPRDEYGRWNDGSGNLNVGHALAVARHEGIDEKHHEDIRRGITSGRLDTREKVLGYIDELHKAKQETATHAATANTKERIDNIAARYKIGGMALEALHDEIPRSKHLANRVEEVGVVATAAAVADGSPQVQLHHVLEAIHYVDNEQGFAGHKQKVDKAAEKENHRRVRQGLAPRPDADATRANAIARQVDTVRRSEVRETRDQVMAARERAFGPMQRHQEMVARALGYRTRKSEDEEEDMSDTLIAFGEGIKSVEETADSYKFGAFLVVFDSPDISQFKDSFTKSTDFGFEDGETRPLLYNHGLDGTFGKTTIGKARLFMKDAGVWMEGEVKKRRDYLEKHVERVGEGLKATVRHRGIEAPMFGASSGATGHAVVREAKSNGHEIKQWFIGEASITPTPAEPMTACLSLKSLQEMEEEEGVLSVKYSDSQPRGDDGRWSGGSGGGSHPSGGGKSKLSKDRLDAIAKQYGVSSNSVLHSVIADAHDKGHINSAADLHNILSNSAYGGHDVADIEKHINEHGSGNGKYINYLNDKPSSKPKDSGGKLPKAHADHVLESHGFGPNSVVAGVVQEARKKGYIGSPVALDKIMRELGKDDGSGGDEIDHLHSLINRFGDGPSHDGKFRSSLLGLGGKKSWDEVPENERALAIKTYLVAGHDAPEEEMASGAETKSFDWELEKAILEVKCSNPIIYLAGLSA